ncbi:MAG: hypothetical protein KGJ45_11645 [Elusimicrobia bacterium]|nr:hypothetical protein [Elusimicrobiota bacterium]
MAAINVQIPTPVTMSQYAQTFPEGDLTRIFVENMVKESDVMRAIKILPAVAGKREFMDISKTPVVGFRGMNAAGNTDTGQYNLREEDTFFIDEYIQVDRALVDRWGPAHRARQRELKTIALAQYFSSTVMKGDHTANPKGPDGLQVRCQTLNYNLLNNSTASGGAALSLANLDQLFWLVNKPTHWIFPRGLMPYMEAAARNNTLVNQTVAFTQDDFGRRIMSYKGLPILYGYDPDDTPDLLPFTEVGAGGGAAQTASIYLVRFDDSGIYAIEQTSLQVRDEGPVPGVPFMSDHIKWDWGVAREHPRAVARLSSITAATITA